MGSRRRSGKRSPACGSIDGPSGRRYQSGMSLLRHIRLCNEFSASRFLPLIHERITLGLVRRDNAERLRRFPQVFAVTGDAVTLLAGGGFEPVSAAIDAVVEQLVADGVVAKWRNEFFAVAPCWGAPPHFRLDRGVVGFFGTRSYGVHLNGYHHAGGRQMLWIGRRATNKAVAPGKLDNLVAGGMSWEHGPDATLVKEAEEEAAIPRALIDRAHPAGAVSYRMETKTGVRNDTLFLYDLDVPADFTPKNNDGELQSFTLMPADEVIERVRAGDEFKFNVNLVIIDFALRHGLVTAREPDYLDIVSGLHRVLD
jgi:8-oxo-dGTP pyrophosphatase MutT (NUDIX family)